MFLSFFLSFFLTMHTLVTSYRIPRSSYGIPHRVIVSSPSQSTQLLSRLSSSQETERGDPSSAAPQTEPYARTTYSAIRTSKLLLLLPPFNSLLLLQIPVVKSFVRGRKILLTSISGLFKQGDYQMYLQDMKDLLLAWIFHT